MGDLTQHTEYRYQIRSPKNEEFARQAALLFYIEKKNPPLYHKIYFSSIKSCIDSKANSFHNSDNSTINEVNNDLSLNLVSEIMPNDSHLERSSDSIFN